MDIRLSEIVAALSHALDITEGQPMGHAERTCLIGLRLADATGLDPERRSSLFYALLLKDAGCSTTSATTAEVFGSDELRVKREGRLVDPLRPAQSLRYLSRTIAPGAPLRTRARHLRALVAMGVDGARQLGAMRCERGANVARSIDLDDDAARAIHELDEHWDGHGYPAQAISPLARIICLAQAMEVFWQQGGAHAACAVARERSGTWFDPALVGAAAEFEHDGAFWASLHDPDVNALEPADRVERADDEVLSIMGRDAGPKLDAGAFAALETWLPRRGASFADAA
jgi:HD domain